MKETKVAQAVGDAVRGEAGDTAPEGWPPEDKEWLGHIPVNLRRIAVRHGRKVFAQVMLRGSTMHAVSILARHTQSNNACKQAGGMLVQSFNTLFQQLNAQWGITDAMLAECDQDIQRFAAIAQAAPSTAKPGDRMSPGGIILDS